MPYILVLLVAVILGYAGEASAQESIWELRKGCRPEYGAGILEVEIVLETPRGILQGHCQLRKGVPGGLFLSDPYRRAERDVSVRIEWDGTAVHICGVAESWCAKARVLPETDPKEAIIIPAQGAVPGPIRISCRTLML